MENFKNELQIGKAGEYLVCADLIMNGFIAYPSEQGLNYDVVLDTGVRLLKIQVKTTLKPRVIPQRKAQTTGYVFNISRNGKGNKSCYKKGDIDIFALVCLETKKIGYVSDNQMTSTIILRDDRIKGQYYDEAGVKMFSLVNDMYNSGLNKKQISNKLGLNYSSVFRYLSSNFVPHQSKALYFSDIIRNKEWFYGV